MIRFLKPLFILFFVVTSAAVFSQTISTIVDVGGFNNQICVGDSGPGNVNNTYDCKGSPLNGFYPNAWGSGSNYNFADPVPPGNLISNIEITLFNSTCNSNGDIIVEGSSVMFMLTGTACSTAEPCGNNTVVSSSFPEGLSDSEYNYGGSNNFDVMVDPGGDSEAICFTHAEIVFTYFIPANAVPTISQWGLIILGLILMICGVVTFKRMVFLRSSSAAHGISKQ